MNTPVPFQGFWMRWTKCRTRGSEQEASQDPLSIGDLTWGSPPHLVHALFILCQGTLGTQPTSLREDLGSLLVESVLTLGEWPL